MADFEGMLPLHVVDAALARRELLTLVTLGDRGGLPADTWVFVEHYCAVVGCDCRRVVVEVASLATQRTVASLHHYFDPPAEGRAQTAYVQGGVQTELAPALLEAFAKSALEPRWRLRFEAHYEYFKRAIADPSHPVQASLPRPERPKPKPVVSPARVGRNEPCPCGSGKKWKKCHGQG